MKFWLLLKSGCSVPDFEAECEADNKEESAKKFKEENPNSLREFRAEDLLEHICKTPEPTLTKMF